MSLFFWCEMVRPCKWLLLLAFAVTAGVAFPAAEEAVDAGGAAAAAASAAAPSLWEEGVEGAYRLVRECGDKPFTSCLKMRALTLVDRALRRPDDLALMDGVTLVRAPGSDAARGRALTEEELDASLPQDADEKDAQVETLLVDRVARFLQSHTLQLKVPDAAISEVRKTLDEGAYSTDEDSFPLQTLSLSVPS